MDIKNALLHCDPQETVFMKPPPGYACPPGLICGLCKSLYGIKQAPHAWFQNFEGAISKLDSTRVQMIIHCLLGTQLRAALCYFYMLMISSLVKMMFLALLLLRHT